MLPVLVVIGNFVAAKFHKRLVLIIDLFGIDHWEAGEFGGFEIGFVHVNCGDLVIVVASVIGDALIEIVARTINSDFELGGLEFGLVGATRLINGVKNMEVLADAG